jgi:hypothetical protein
MTVRELTYLPAGKSRAGYHHTARYDATGGLPWYRETETQPDKDAAWAAAGAWVTDYQARDRYGNMASALGIVADPKGGWRGVINYFHSNT